MSNTPYTYTGKVHQIGKTQTFQPGFAKRTLVLVDDPTAKYPNYAAFDFLKTKNGDGTMELNKLCEGMTVEVKFYIQANESKKYPGSWFCSNRAVGVEKIGEQTELLPTSRPVPHPAEPPASVAADESIDDMPF